MKKIAKVYVHIENAKYDASGTYSAGKYANYLSQGEENRKKNSIRKGAPWLSQGKGAKSYERTPGDDRRFWKYHDKRWKNSKESSGNKRKKTVKFGAVAGNATTIFRRGLVTLPNGMEYWKVRVLERRIAKLFPKDCPVSIYMHHGKEYDGRECDNDHLHLMFSDRHDYGIGRKVEKLFDSIFDKRTPRGRPVIQDMIEDVVRQFYIDFGYEIDEPKTKESYMRHIERYEEKLKELENDRSRNKPFRKIKEFFYENKSDFYKNKIEEYYEKIVEKKVEEFDNRLFKYDVNKELENYRNYGVYISKEDNKYLMSSRQVCLEQNHSLDDKVENKIDDKDKDKDKFEFKADITLEAATNKEFEADVVFNAIDKITHDKNEILYEESIRREEDEIERNAYIENNKLLHSNDENLVARVTPSASCGSANARVSKKALQRFNFENNGMKAVRLDKNSEQVRKFEEAARRLKEVQQDHTRQAKQTQDYLEQVMIEAGLMNNESTVSKPKSRFKK